MTTTMTSHHKTVKRCSRTLYVGSGLALTTRGCTSTTYDRDGTVISSSGRGNGLVHSYGSRGKVFEDAVYYNQVRVDVELTCKWSERADTCDGHERICRQCTKLGGVMHSRKPRFKFAPTTPKVERLAGDGTCPPCEEGALSAVAASFNRHMEGARLYYLGGLPDRAIFRTKAACKAALEKSRSH